MLMPKRTKYRKMHRGRMNGVATRGNYLDFGDYGIMALECGWITSRQIEAARIAMTRHIKRGGQVWIRIFPDKSYTKKPLEQRMGKGKAPVEGWVAVIKPGRIMFEMAGPAEEVAKEGMRLAMMKLPLDCKFVTKKDFVNGPPLEVGKEHVQEKVKRKYHAIATPNTVESTVAASDEPIVVAEAMESTPEPIETPAVMTDVDTPTKMAEAMTETAPEAEENTEE